MKDLEGVGEVLLSSCTMLEKSEVSFDTMPSTAGVPLLTSDDEFWDLPLTSTNELYDDLRRLLYVLEDESIGLPDRMRAYRPFIRALGYCDSDSSYSIDRRYEPIFSSRKLQFSHTPKSRSTASLFQVTW
jgi:hypothetical protein